MSSARLIVAGLTKKFEAGIPVVSGASFQVNEGEIFSLLGASGCGKTTLLRLIAGLEEADDGSIELDGNTLAGPGKHVAPEKRGIGFVFQDFALFPNLTVEENVAFGLRGIPKAERKERAIEVLRMVGLQREASRRPAGLSGGQQQRVALARALAPRPGIILLDEPFSSLDALMREEMRGEVQKVLRDAGMTAIMVTHDQEEALSFADRVGVMRNGRLEQVDTPEELYNRPRTLFVAQFLGRTNLIFSEASGRSATCELGQIELDREASGNVLVSVRPEHLTLVAPEQDASTPCEVTGRDFRGHDITYRVKTAVTELLVHTDNRVLFNVGDRAGVIALAPGVVLEADR